MFFLLIGCFLSSAIRAQSIDKSVIELPIKDSLITFEKTIKLDSNINKDKLFKAVKDWALSSPNKILKLVNPDTYTIGGWGAVRHFVGPFGKILFDQSYLFFVKVQDGQYQITLSDFARKKAYSEEFTLDLENYYRVDKIYINLQNGLHTPYDIKKEKQYFKALHRHAEKEIKSLENFVSKSFIN